MGKMYKLTRWLATAVVVGASEASSSILLRSPRQLRRSEEEESAKSSRCTCQGQVALCLSSLHLDTSIKDHLSKEHVSEKCCSLCDSCGQTVAGAGRPGSKRLCMSLLAGLPD